MKLLKIRRLVSLVTCINLVLQTFLPFTLALPAYAEDTATDSGTVVSAIESTESAAIITPAPEVTPEVTEETSQITDDKTATFDNVSVGQTYVSKDGKATVTFTEITGESGNLVIKEITLTPEQMQQSGAISDIAYDITSSMADGTFKFDLTLPKPDAQNIEVKYSEDGQDFATSGGVSTTENEVVVSDVNHFTIFVVTGGIDVTSTWGDHTINVSDTNELKTSDNVYYESQGSWPTGWHSNFQNNQYIEFTFNPTVPAGAVISDAKIIFEYQRGEFRSGSARDAQIRAWNGTDFSEVIADYDDLKIDDPNHDETKIISIPLSLVDTVQKANAFKFRFYMYGKSHIWMGQLKTKHDYVALDYTYTIPDTTKPVISSHPDVTQEVIGLSSAVVNYTLPSVTDNVSTGLVATCSPVSGSTFAYGTTTVTCNTTDGAGNSAISTTFSVIVRDTVAPTATVDYSTTAPTRGSVTATITPSESVTGELTHVFSANGSYTFNFTDAAGNSGSVIATVNNIDTTAPATPELLSPDDNIYRSPSPSNFSDWSDVTDANGVVYRYQSAQDADFTHLYYDSNTDHVGPLTDSMIMNPGEPEVTYYWRVQACDTLGNCSAWSTARKINIDNSAPTKPVFTSPANDTITKINSVTLNWTGGDDAGSGVKGYIFRYVYYPANGSTPLEWNTGLVTSTSKTRSGTFGHGQGRYEMYIKVVDNLGFTSVESDPLNILYDATAPDFVANISFLPASPTNNNDVVWSWNVADDNVISSGLKQYNWSLLKSGVLQSSGSTTATSLSMALSDDGTYSLQVAAEDNIGNISASNSSSDFVLDRVAPTASFRHFINGVEFIGSVARVKNISALSFTGSYFDADPSTGLKQDSFVIFQAQDDGTFAFSQNGKRAYCSWRTGDNTIALSGTSATLENVAFTKCVADLPEGEYYMSHQVYDNAIRQDIPSITQFRDVLGLHFIVDKTAPVSTITSPESSQYFNGAINISGNTQDNSGVAKVDLSYANFDGEVCGEFSPIQTLTPDGSNINYSWSYSWTPSAEGNYCIKAAGTDVTGNEEHSAIVMGVTYDTTLPVVTLGETPVDGLLTNQNDQTFTATVSEPVVSCTLNFNGNYAERQIANGLSDGVGFSYVISGDDRATNYVLPFLFPFYGNTYNDLSVSTNSLIDFNSTGNASYPGSVSELSNITGLSMLWTDLVTTVTARAEADNVRFRWSGYGWSTGGYLTNEAVLRSNGTIELHYGDVYLPGRTVTSGISSGDGSDYVLTSVNGSSSVSPISYSYSGGASESYSMTKDQNGSYSVTVPNIADGRVNYSVTCEDYAANEGVSTERSMIVDTQAPTLSERTTFEGWYNTDQEADFTFTDENGLAQEDRIYCTITTEGENQTCSVTPNVCDTAGNCTGEEAFTSNGANIDKAAPVLGISLNPASPDADNGWYKTQPEATLSVIDANPMFLQYQWDSTAGEWTDYVSPIKPATEGTHILYFRAEDKAGNKVADSKEIKWDQTELEESPLKVSVDPNPTSGNTAKVKWEAAKDNTGIDKYEVRWYLNGGTSSQDHTVTVGADVREKEIDQLVEGRWTVSVRAFDTAGHSKDATAELIVDRTGPAAPVLSLTGTGVGTASLSWTPISDAVDYIVWYGTTPGGRLFGARVGNTTSYTVRGLGAGNYYFIVKAVDAAQNQGSESNEVNTGNIEGAAGVLPNTPAEGFAAQVLGTNTDSTPSAQVSPEVKGSSTDEKGFNWWWLLLILIPLYFGVRKASSRIKNRQ